MILDTEQSSRRWWTLGALCAVLLVVGLDLTVLTVALPLVATDLGASVGELQWIHNAYTVVLAALLLPVGQLGDRFGRKKLLLVGLAVFGGASLVCAFATTAPQLIAGRALLGVGAALLTTLGLAVLLAVFPPAEQPRAIAVQALAVSAGIPLGPILGGLLVDRFWWGSVFLVTVPLVVVAGVALARLVPESRAEHRVRVDGPGAVLAVVGIALTSYGLIHAGEHGWTDPVAVGAIAVGVAATAGFVAWQRRAAHPLADLSLLRERGFGWGAALSAAVQFTVFGIMFLLPQYLQAVLGSTPLQIGLQLLPFVAAMLAGVVLGGALRDRLGVRAVMAGGFVVLAAGFAAGALSDPVVGSDPAAGFGPVAAWTAAIGLGFGLAMPPAIDIATTAVPAGRGSVGSAMLQSIRQVGAVLGVAVMGSVLALTYRGSVAVGGLTASDAESVLVGATGGQAVAQRLARPDLATSVAEAFVAGVAAAFWVGAGVALACAAGVAVMGRTASARIGA